MIASLRGGEIDSGLPVRVSAARSGDLCRIGTGLDMDCIASRKSSGHLPLPSLMRSTFSRSRSRSRSWSRAGTITNPSSTSSATRVRSTPALSLGRRSRIRTGDAGAASALFFPTSSATALPSVRVNDGYSDGTNDVASVVIVRIVPNLPPPPPPPPRSHRLE
ncbi:hypothetical protein DENSPDRAFT_834716 [Dentipellis sp. KUC8613]|nr:hypothetical protein DENSPDRAFT_834716 [Dentipellis sp. KUC8613]